MRRRRSAFARTKPKIRYRTRIKYRIKRIGSMARRRRHTTHRIGGIRGFARNPLITKVATGLGFGTIAALITSRFAPQYTSLASLAGAFYGGGVEGLIGGEAVKAIAGVPSAFGGIGQQTNGGSGWA